MYTNKQCVLTTNLLKTDKTRSRADLLMAIALIGLPLVSTDLISYFPGIKNSFWSFIWYRKRWFLLLIRICDWAVITKLIQVHFWNSTEGL